MIIFNKEFEKLYSSLLNESCSIPNNLLSLINNGFVTHENSCVFFRDKQPFDDDVNDNNFYDKTEQECFYNDLRISDYVEKDLIVVAINLSKMIIQKLQKQIPEKQFEVVTAFDDFEETIDAVIKVHTLRSDEAPYIDLQSLDDYRQPMLIGRTI